jgi:hypothetical protein
MPGICESFSNCPHQSNLGWPWVKGQACLGCRQTWVQILILPLILSPGTHHLISLTLILLIYQMKLNILLTVVLRSRWNDSFRNVWCNLDLTVWMVSKVFVFMSTEFFLCPRTCLNPYLVHSWVPLILTSAASLASFSWIPGFPAVCCCDSWRLSFCNTHHAWNDLSNENLCPWAVADIRARTELCSPVWLRIFQILKRKKTGTDLNVHCQASG